MLAQEEYVQNEVDNPYKQIRNIYHTVFDLNKEGRISIEELSLLLSYYTAKYVELELGSKVNSYIDTNFKKFFERGFLSARE